MLEPMTDQYMKWLLVVASGQPCGESPIHIIPFFWPCCGWMEYVTCRKVGVTNELYGITPSIFSLVGTDAFVGIRPFIIRLGNKIEKTSWKSGRFGLKMFFSQKYRTFLSDWHISDTRKCMSSLCRGCNHRSALKHTSKYREHMHVLSMFSAWGIISKVSVIYMVVFDQWIVGRVNKVPDFAVATSGNGHITLVISPTTGHSLVIFLCRMILWFI